MHESQCQSFGNNPDRCSQPRKISIGVVVDSVAKFKCKNVDADYVAIPAAGDTNYGKGDSKKRVANLALGNQGELSSHSKAPRISTRSIHPNSTSKAIHPLDQPSDLHATHERFNTPTRTKITPGASSVPFSDYQNLKFHSKETMEMGGNDSVGEISGKIHFTVAQADMSVKASAEDKSERAGTRGSESLRVQLQKILETVSSPTKLCSNSEELDVGAKGPSAEKIATENHIPKASSDTIEDDTQSHDPTVRRPVTRSLNRRRAPPKSQRRKPKKKVPPCAQEERFDMFYFGEKKARELRGDATGGSMMTHESLTKRKSSKIEAHDMSTGMDAYKKKEQNTKCNKAPYAERYSDMTRSYEKVKSAFVEPRVDTSEKYFYKSPAVEKETSKSVFVEPRVDTSENDFYKSPTVEKETSKSVFVEPRVDTSENDFYKSPVVENEKSKSGFVEPRVDISEKDFCKSPVVKQTEQLRDINGLKLQENLHDLENLQQSTLKDLCDPKPDVQRPTFGTKTPLERSFIGSLPKSKRVELDEHSHTEIVFNPKSFQNFKGFQRSRKEAKSNGQDVSSDDVAVMESPLPFKPKSLFGEDNHVLFQSSPDDRNSVSSEDRVHVEGCRKSPSLSTEIGTPDSPKEAKFAVKPSKGFFNEKENEDIESPLRQSDTSEEDGFDRAVTLFAFALQRVRRKMKSMADKRSAEILMSAAEGIQRELQNAEIQTHADLRTLTSKSKANQKHLDTIFQEQQEQLNAIYERFKEQLHQHLQGCRSTLESLEEHENELKATVEKQKVSKIKYLLQVEEKIQTQLVDADRRITDVHHLARGKMHQLKLVVAECLKLS
ncbi:unnamed protein product [Cuscuta campestris]|uniref:Meiosis-specific protein ASY3-like coiled-coil domain-containing protein n=1 Tax=Cuscuta campestris TaxID=132261 RepID=A0A484K4T8_9ASTE|nr:unnamed protein product [Cuscuta campestris]